MILQQAYVVDDKKAKVSSNDTTAGYLNGKLIPGINIDLTEGSDGGNETLTIATEATLAVDTITINTQDASRKLETLDTTNPQERWTHTAGSVYGEVQANSSGHLIFTSTSNKTLINNSYVAPTLANEVATKQYVDDAVILQIADEWEKSYLGPNYDMSITFDETLGGIINTNELVPEDLHIETGADKSLILENGLLALKETTTPTAVADYGRIYTKSDNKLYFQDGSGVEHEVQFVS